MGCIFRYALSVVYWLPPVIAPFFCISLLAASVANAELAGLPQTLVPDSTSLAQQSQISDSLPPRSSNKQSNILEGDQLSGESARMLYRLQLLVTELTRLKSLVKEQSVVLKKIIADRNKRRFEMATRLTGFDDLPSTDSAKNFEAKKAQEERAAYKIAFELASQQRFNEAVKFFQSFLADYPDGRLSADALFWIGEICLVLSEPQIEKSRQAYMQLLQRFPEHEHAAAALYKLGHIYHQLGQKEKSEEFFGRVIQEYPASISAHLASTYDS